MAQLLNLDIDLSKFNNKLSTAGQGLEKTFSAAISNVDKKFEKSFEFNKKKIDGKELSKSAESAGEKAGLGFSGAFLAVFAGQLAAGQLSKAILPNLIRPIIRLSYETKKFTRESSKSLNDYAKKVKETSDLKLFKKQNESIFTFIADQQNKVLAIKKDEQNLSKKEISENIKILKQADRKLEWQKKMNYLSLQYTKSISVAASAFVGLGKVISSVLKGFARFVSFATKGLISIINVIGKIAKSATLITAPFVAIATVIGYALKKIWDLGKAAYDAYTPIRMATKSLETTLSGMFKKPSKELKKFVNDANDISLVSGADAQDVLAAQSQLLRGGFDPSQVKALLSAAINVMDDPANKVNNMQDAVTKIMDALNGSESAAKQLRLSFRATGDDAASMEARAREIAESMTSVYGGAPKFKNVSKQFTNVWNEITLIIGEKLTPFFEKTITQAIDLVQGFIVSGAIDDLANKLFTAFDTIKEFLLSFFTDIENIYDLLVAIFNKATIVIGNFFVSMINKISALFSGMLEGLLYPLTKALEVLGKGNIAKSITDSIGNLKTDIILGDTTQVNKELDDAIDRYMSGKSKTGNYLQDIMGQGAASIARANLAVAGAGDISASAQFLAEASKKRKEERDEALKILAEKAKELGTNSQEIQLSFGIKTLRSDRFRRVRARR
jgi:hypothetical protein